MSSKGYAIITGASRGIGKGIFLELAKEGYDLVGTYTSQKSDAKMQALIDQVEKEYGVKAMSVRSDVGTREGCQAIVDAAVKNFGTNVTVLVNNAGMGGGALYKDETLDNIARTIDVDLMAALNLSYMVLPYMLENKKGDIINMSSMGPLIGLAGQSIYCTAKYGLIGFSKSLAKEVAKDNIKVNCIAPGIIDTEMVAEADPQQIAAVEVAIPMGRRGSTEEIALCAKYILESDYLTGQTISPNGGFIAVP